MFYFSIRIPAAECMIGRDRVVNSRDLHTAMAPGAVKHAACRYAAGLSNAQGVNKGRTRSMPSKRIPPARDAEFGLSIPSAP
jgi:hypothetical protein